MQTTVRAACTRTAPVQVSEKIVLLDDELRKLKAREAECEVRLEHMGAEKATLLAVQEKLRGEVGGGGACCGGQA